MGTVINERYEIRRLLGVGGMGIVYQGSRPDSRHRRGSQAVAAARNASLPLSRAGEGRAGRSDLGYERAVLESDNNVRFAYYLLGEYDNAVLYLERSLALVEKNDDRNASICRCKASASASWLRGGGPRRSNRFSALSRSAARPG